MPYITASELTVALPQNITITPTSLPLTQGEVGSLIAEVCAELDSAAAAAGYAVPIDPTATVAYAQMQRWTRQGAGAAVLGVLFPNMGGPGGQTTLADQYRAAYQAALLALRKGDLPLVGAGEDTGSGGRELPRSFSTSNPGASTGIAPHVTLDTVY